MTRLRMKEIRDKKKDELLKTLTDHKKELSQLRVAQQVSGTATKLGKIRVMRKNIARVLTVLNQNERENLRKFYKEQKAADNKIPKSLRPKLTHRRRLALKPDEKKRRTRRQLRQAAKYPKRLFAVKM